MPKVGFYAVRVGRKTGVYNNWEECKNQTQGHPNARYKRFNTLREAEDFVHGSISSFPLPPQKSHSDVGVSSTPKGQKRVYAEMDWDVVYSDGACKGNGNVGSVAGVGVWWGHNDPRNIAERCPGDQTNNRAELIAILRVLETAPLSKNPLTIKTDSKYSIHCFERWIKIWKKNSWKTASGTAVKNEGIIRCIDLHKSIRLKRGQQVLFQHVKGHSGEVGNEGADLLANEGTLEPPVQECDWKGMEAQLVTELNSIDSDLTIASIAVVETREETEPIPLEPHAKSRKLADNQLDGTHTSASSFRMNHSDPVLAQKVVQASRIPTSIPCHNVPPAELRSRQAEQDESTKRLAKPTSSTSRVKFFGSSAPTSEPRKAHETEVQSSPTQASPDVPATCGLIENAKQTVVLASESQDIEKTGLPRLNIDATPMHLSRVFSEARSTDNRHHDSTARFLERSSLASAQGLHADPPSQSHVRVFYAAPPLVPVCVEDVNFEDYADCLVDGAELELELLD